jgi:hypothetical protein
VSAARPTEAEIAGYLAENYGVCDRAPCLCIFPVGKAPGGVGVGWLGKGCSRWHPVAGELAKTIAEGFAT